MISDCYQSLRLRFAARKAVARVDGHALTAEKTAYGTIEIRSQLQGLQ